jgi:hypothetical protein
MPAYELAILIMVGCVVAAMSFIGIYVLARAYFGGRSTFRPAPRRER